MDKVERVKTLANGFKLDLEKIYPAEVFDKLDELVEGYNEGLEGIVKRWAEQVEINDRLSEFCSRILERLDNHISRKD